MSWNASLHDDRSYCEGDWHYTHNCNGMIEAVLGDAIDSTAEPFWSQLGNKTMGRGAWWDLLDGKNGPEGAELLGHIIKGLGAEPDRFRAMNPPNGWGDYDSLLEVLCSMHEAVPEWPTLWSVNG